MLVEDEPPKARATPVAARCGALRGCAGSETTGSLDLFVVIKMVIYGEVTRQRSFFFGEFHRESHGSMEVWIVRWDWGPQIGELCEGFQVSN